MKKKQTNNFSAKSNLTPEAQIQVLNSLPVGVILFTLSKIVFINEAARKIIQASKKLEKEITSYSVFDFLLPDYHARIKDNYRKILQGEEFIPYHTKFKNLKNQVIDIDVKSCPVMFNGKLVMQTVFTNVSERVKIEEQLIESENNLQLILNGIDEVVYYLDLSGERKIRFVSENIVDTLGITVEDYKKKYVLGDKKILKHIHPDDIKEVISASDKLRKSKKPQVFTYRCKNIKTNQYIWLQERIIPKFDDKKKHIGNLGISRDITKQKEAELSLIQNELRFKLLTENSTDIIFLYDFKPKEHYTYVSESIKTVLGYPPSAFYKDSNFVKTLILPDEQSTKKIGKNTPTKQIINKSLYKFKTKTGGIVWLETRYSLLKDAKGDVVTLIGISRDVTKEREADLLRKEAEEKFKLIAENANDIIYFFTYYPKPAYIYVSPSVKNVLGYNPGDFYKNPFLGSTLITDAEGYKALEERTSKLQKSGKLERSSALFQYKTKSGKMVWLEDIYSPIYDEKGNIKCILGISRDITREKIYQLELEQKWNNYQNLIDTSPLGIFIHDQGICLYCNKTAVDILDEKNKLHLIGKNLISFIIPEQRERAILRMQKAAKGEEQNDLAYKIKTVTNKVIDVELKTVPFIYNGKQCVQTIISNLSSEKKLAKETIRAEVAEDLNKQLIEEIKYRKKIEKELVTQTTKYEAIFNNTSHLVWTVNKDLLVTSFNNNYYKYIKNIFDHDLKIGDPVNSINPKPDADLGEDFWINKYNEVFFNKKDNKAEYFEIKNHDRKGNAHYREIFLHPIRDSKGIVEEIAVIGHDVTERKKSEQKIIEQAATLNAVFNSGDQLIWTINKEYALTSFNQNFSDAMYMLYGIRPSLDTTEAYNPQKGTATAHTHQWWINKYDEVFMHKKSIKFTVEQIDRSNNKYFRQIFINPIINDNTNTIEEISCLSYDITELKYLQSESLRLEQKLSTIFESTSHLIWTVNKNLLLTSYNKNFAKVFEGKYKHKLILNTKPSELLKGQVRQDYINYWEPLYERVFKGEKLKFERKEIDPKNGQITYREIYLNPIQNEHDEIIEIACLAHDITENKNFEYKILNQSAKLKAIFESTSLLIWTVNQNLELTSYNTNYYNLIKDNIVEQNLNDNPEGILIKNTIKNPGLVDFWHDKYKKVLSGTKDSFVHKSMDKEGNEIYREIYLHPIYYGTDVVEVSAIAQDITERINNEQKILNQSAKLKAIFESGTQLMWTINQNKQLTSFNQNYANAIHDLYDFYPQENKSLKEISDKTSVVESFWDEKYEIAFKGFPVEFSSERSLLNGNKVFRQYYLYPIKNNKNEVEEVSGLGFDVTENKQNEGKIIQSLKEKEILLKEVHHRVKNNMQVISSILNLQSSYVKDAYALNLLKECQNRVKSMAFIHESLYQTKNFESVNFSEYVTTLTKNLIHTYSVNTQKIKLILTLDKLFLNLDTSIPCGLIINEIISNSLKYAFPGNRDGIIFVNLKVVRNRVKIEAGDNGVGIPAEIDIKQTQTLGLQLVDTLIEQINGSLELDRTKGTKFIIDFKI